MISMVSRDLVNRVVSQFPIVSYLSSRAEMRDSGRDNILCTCPVCNGRLKLSVHRRTKVIHCFKCDEGGYGYPRWNGKGNIITLISLFEGIPGYRAFQRLFEFSGVTEIEFTPQSVETVSLPEDAIKLSEVPETSEPNLLLLQRHCGHLRETSYVCVGGDYSYRWIFPVYWNDELVGFEAKAYRKQQPKSLFPEWFATSNYVYRTRNWDASNPMAVITESVLDAETLGCNALGLFGSSLRDGQLQRLFELQKNGLTDLVWMLDADAAAKSAKAILEKTMAWFNNFFVVLHGRDDPNELGREKCWEHVRKAIRVENPLDLAAILLT